MRISYEDALKARIRDIRAEEIALLKRFQVNWMFLSLSIGTREKGGKGAGRGCRHIAFVGANDGGDGCARLLLLV